MNRDELRSAQQEIFDTLVPALIVGTLVIGWLVFALSWPTQAADAQTQSALVGRWMATTGAVLLVGGLAWAMRKRGHFRAATHILVVGFTALIAAALALWPDASTSILPYLYPLVVIIAGFLVRPATALQMVGVIVLVTAAALLAGGHLTVQSAAQLLPALLLTSLSAVLTWLSAGRMVAALDRAARSEAQVQQQAGAFRAGQQQVEHAVAYLQANRDRLAEARRTLKETQSATARLIANLSRDFRAPLNVITNFAYILAEGRRGSVTGEQQGYLQRIYKAGEHLLRTLSDLADLAKVEAGEFELNRQPIDLAQLSQEAIQSVPTTVAGRQLELHNAVPADLPQPVADEACVRQILLNLLEATVQRAGRGHVTLSAEAQNGEVVVSVSGAGVELEDVDQVFEPFSRPGQAALATGLGLPISKRLIELHGGRVWVESRPDAGFTFYFTLPLQPPPPLPADERDAEDELPDFETLLLALRTDEGGSESPPHARSQLSPGSRVAPTVRERFVAVGLVGLFSILALIVGGLALQSRGAQSQYAATIVPTVPPVTTPTAIPLVVVASPTPGPTSTFTPSPTPTATVPTETAGGAAGPQTPTASPSHTPSPTATAIRPTAMPSPPRVTPPPPRATPTAAPSPQPRIVFVANREGQFDLYTMSLDGTDLTRLTTDPADDRSPVVSPDGKRILFSSERGGNRDLYVVNAEGGGLARLTSDSAHDEAPTWSPDGRRIAFASYRQGNYDIYVANADGRGVSPLTTSLAWEGSPAWSPDGRWIAFVSDQTGHYEIYVIGSDGSELTRLTEGGSDHGAPTWSPDGSRLAFHAVDSASPPGGRPRRSIFVVDADGGHLTRLTDATADDVDPAWTPDGRILFASNRGGNFDLYLVAPDGGGLIRLTDTPFDELEPAWSPGF